MDKIVAARPLQDGKTHRFVQAASSTSRFRASCERGRVRCIKQHALSIFSFAILAGPRVFIWIIHGRGSYEIASHADIRG
jgi:hypothetical protein